MKLDPLQSTVYVCLVLPRSSLHLSRVHYLVSVGLPVVCDEQNDDVHVFVFFGLELFEISGLVVWTEDKYDPFHRTYDPLAIDLFDPVLRLTLHFVECVLHGHESVFFHLFVSVLGVPDSRPVLFEILLIQVLQIFNEVLQIHLFHHGVHSLLLQDHDILQVVVVFRFQLLVSLLLSHLVHII